MAFYLRQSKKNKGVYLQMYESFWVPEKKQPRSRYVEAFGYVHELISEEMPDPVAYYTEYVKKKNEEHKAQVMDATRPRAFGSYPEKYIGHFLLHTLLDELNVKETIDILASNRQFQFSIYDMISQLIYARVLEPASRCKAVSNVFPHLYNYIPMSEDQVDDGIQFIGSSYKKYIELFNNCYERFYKRDCNKVFFDCTNYYFEIDLPADDKQKGPSKERSNNPIIGQALLLDADLVPLGMQMFPGNQSEKPFIRSMIEDMKNRYHISGRTIQVADKGLNCARNIYAAVRESSDGYIFSKSIHGTSLSQQEKQWLLLENDQNVFTDYTDRNGNLLYRIKSCIDTFSYHFEEIDPSTGEIVKTTFSVREKRIVSYNPSLARKQRAEILKQANKAASYNTYKKLAGELLGDASKYVTVITTDSKGNKIPPVFSLNQDKINEDLKYVGYNMIVTSELEMDDHDIYKTYHSLWKIEESFRISKSFLDARPVYASKKECIYGHFLICYLSLFLLRVLEIKCFKNRVNAYDLIHFMRDFRAVQVDNDTFINISSNQILNEKIKDVTGLTMLDALFLTKKEIDSLFKNCLLLQS